jgi:uncharacterized membrane protein YeiH
MLPHTRVDVGTFLLVLDLAGTFVFALSGAIAGVRHKVDLFGVLVLSFAAANAGGITRDLLIGAVPPVGISDWRYIVASLSAGLVFFFWDATVVRLRATILLLDAAGLALFAVTGTVKALTYQLGPGTAILLGVLTGIGGGVLRDLLISEVPTVLRSELYAIAALSGATIVVLARELGLPANVGTVSGALVCFALRAIAIRRGWRLPVAGEWRRTVGDAIVPVSAVSDADVVSAVSPDEPEDD